VLQSVYRVRGPSKRNSPDELHPPICFPLVYWCRPGLLAIFRKDIGRPDHGSECYHFLLITSSLSDCFLKGLVSGVDQFDALLFSSRSFTRPQDHLLQKMMGIQVVVEGGKDHVRPCPNALSESRLSPTLATRIFTALCGYRLVDVITFLGENYPSATIVERTPAPATPLQVRSSNELLSILRN
jgi:hypothetical protein